MAKKNKRNYKKLAPAATAVVILILAILAIYLLAIPEHSTSVISSSSPQNTVASTDKQQGVENNPSANSSVSSPSISPKNGSQQTATDLASPSGTFVSNHRPNLSGSPSPSSEQSVCNTKPGAICYIRFTKGNITKQLAAEVVDGNGSAYWNWDVDRAGLSEGSWQITAVASADGQTKTTTDRLPLLVQP